MQGVVAQLDQERKVWTDRYVRVIGRSYRRHLCPIHHKVRFPKRWIERIWTQFATISCVLLRWPRQPTSICSNCTLLTATCWQASSRHLPTCVLMNMGGTW